MLYLAKGSFWLNLATGLNWIILTVTLYAFGNYVEPEAYGTYRYFLSAYSLLTIFSLAGFNTALTRSVAQGNEGEFLRVFKIQTFTSFLGSLVGFGIAGYYYWAGNVELGNGFIIMAIALPLMESLDLYSAFLSGKKLFRIISITSVVSQLVTAIALLAAIFFHTNILLVLVAYFVSWIAVKGYFFVYSLGYQTNNKISGDIQSTGINFSIVNAIADAANYLDRILLFQLMGAREVALYSFAIAPTEQIKALFKNINALILPKFSTRTEEEVRATIVQKTVIVGLVALVFIVTYILLAPLAISLLIPKYVEIIPHSQLVALSLLGVMVIPLTAATNALTKMKTLYLTNTVNPLITIALMFILIPQFGLWGAIWAKVLGRFIAIFTTYFFFFKF